MSQNSQTLLFGGSGFLGPTILEKFPEIISVGRHAPPDYITNRHINLSNLDDLSLLDTVEFDKVIFLVGSSNHHRIKVHPTMGFDYNVLPLKKILYYLQKRNIRKFVCFSTILLYDMEKSHVPVDEMQPINPYSSEYVFSKYISEQVVRFYQDVVPSIIIRFSNIYGPTQLIRPDLVPTLIQKILSPEEPTVWSTKPVRDFLFLDDAAEAIVRLMDTDYTGIINLGTGTAVSIGQIVQILERISGRKVADLGKEVSGPMHFQCDISRVRELTGWQPQHSLEEGLRLTYERMRPWAAACRWWEKKDEML